MWFFPVVTINLAVNLEAVVQSFLPLEYALPMQQRYRKTQESRPDHTPITSRLVLILRSELYSIPCLGTIGTLGYCVIT